MDPEDIIANGCVNGRTSVIDEGEVERAKKLAEVLLLLTSLVTAFTFTAALTIPSGYIYKGSKWSKELLLEFNLYRGFGLLLFMVANWPLPCPCLHVFLLQ